MTMKRHIELYCPNCGVKNQILIWDTINAQISPEDKTALLNGKVNRFICKKCEGIVSIEKSLLYNDMENKFMAYFFPFTEIQKGDFLDYITPDGKLKELERYSELDCNMEVHFVLDMGELIRYIKFRDAICESYKRTKTDKT